MHTINPSRLITLFIPRSFPRTNIFFFFFFLSLCLSLMTLACNSDLPFPTNDENSYWKNFSSFFQDLSLLKFHRFSLSLFLQCFPRARKSHRERPMFRTLLSASFQTFRIYSEISRQFYEPFPSYKRSVTTLLGVTKERGKSWICKGRERERATRVSTDGKVEFQRAS